MTFDWPVDVLTMVLNIKKISARVCILFEISQNCEYLWPCESMPMQTEMMEELFVKVLEIYRSDEHCK